MKIQIKNRAVSRWKSIQGMAEPEPSKDLVYKTRRRRRRRPRRHNFLRDIFWMSHEIKIPSVFPQGNKKYIYALKMNLLLCHSKKDHHVFTQSVVSYISYYIVTLSKTTGLHLSISCTIYNTFLAA